MACEFRKTQPEICPKFAEKLTPDALYWKNLEYPITEKKQHEVTHIDFSPVAPHDYAITNSSDVQVYSHQSKQSTTTFSSRSHFKSYCGSYRCDGQAIVAGCEDSTVRVFSKRFERRLKGHTNPVHVTRFLQNIKRVFSGSDDKTVKLWDIDVEQEVGSYSEHQDYVRCGVASQESSSNIILTGSYDHTVKLFDLRAPASVLTVDHGQVVESVLMFPAGNLFLSAGGNCIKVWDVMAGGRLVAQFSNHHKTITSMCFASDYRRLVSASLDRHVKFYDVGTYQVVHSLEYPSPVISVAISPTDDLVVVGMDDGLLSVRTRREDSELAAAEREKKKRKRSLACRGSVIQPLHSYYKKPEQDDEVIQHHRKVHLEKFDVHLRKFEYTEALKDVMNWRLRSNTPAVTVGMIRELIRRNGLRVALAGQKDEAVARIATFILKNIGETQYIRTLLDVLVIITELYWGADDMLHTHKVLERVNRAVEQLYDVSLEKLQCIALCDVILSSSTAATVLTKHTPVALTNGLSSGHTDSDIEGSDLMDTQP